MERTQWDLDAPGLDRTGTVIRYGHWGRPVLVFPSEQGRMREAIRRHRLYLRPGPLRFFARAASTMRCASATVSASGFSQKTWQPASMAAVAYGACVSG